MNNTSKADKDAMENRLRLLTNAIEYGTTATVLLKQNNVTNMLMHKRMEICMMVGEHHAKIETRNILINNNGVHIILRFNPAEIKNRIQQCIKGKDKYENLYFHLIEEKGDSLSFNRLDYNSYMRLTELKVSRPYPNEENVSKIAQKIAPTFS